ncbi:MAG: PASTA domain-containing protein [Treponema sp.]|jgi:beta-lactam-binding protein with PASTA domain|nr:PASTA domain-containing protein [Treponema sp.]
MGFINFDLDAIEGYVANHLRLFISMALGLLVFVGIIAVSIFFIAVRGAEQTMVPDVQGKGLTEALLELQVKELYPRIQLRYSQSALDRGLILEQDPRGGTIVKAGRRIRLVVSQGVVINRVGNYIGRNIDEVRMDLQTLFASGGTGVSAALPLLSFKEPLMYEYSPEAPGTILQQRPEAGADISGPMTLEFVVSRGPENARLTVPQLMGLSVSGALERISRSGVDFVFSVRAPRNQEKGETVVYQEPPGDTTIPANTTVAITVTSPLDLESGEVFQLFRYTLPRNPYPQPVRLDAIFDTGERRSLMIVEYSGGDFTVPYRLPVGTVLVLSMLNREMFRETVSPPAEALSLDQL